MFKDKSRLFWKRPDCFFVCGKICYLSCSTSSTSISSSSWTRAPLSRTVFMVDMERSSRSMSTMNTVWGASSSRSHRDSSVDSGSGYSKAATPDGTLDGGHMKSFEFETSSKFR